MNKWLMVSQSQRIATLTTQQVMSQALHKKDICQKLSTTDRIVLFGKGQLMGEEHYWLIALSLVLYQGSTHAYI